MSEETKSQQKKNDEIDLLDLFRRMGTSISKGMRIGMNLLGRATLISIIFLLKRWIWLALSIIIGTGISWMVPRLTGKIYSSELTLRSNAVPNSDMITYINRLHYFCIENDSMSLAAALSLPMEKVRLIKDIQAFWAIDMLNDGIPDNVDYKNNFYSNDTTNKRMEDRFVVRGRLAVSKEFPLLSERILEYTRQNPLFQLKNQVRLAQNDEIRVRLVYDIDQLDSLQKVKYFEETRRRIPASGGQMIFLQEQQQNTQLIYDNIYTLYSRKQAIDADMEIYKDVITLLNDFTQPARSINGTLYFGKTIIPAFFTICLLLLILIDNRKKLQEIFRKY
ncbi:MAG: hypothetical protein NT144_13395 [Bacteroidia bacterium]|nr:hypothetical protein [Bacteroidia bacterium]